MNTEVSRQFIILSLNPDTGRYMVLGNYLTYGIIGSMFMDMALEERITIYNSKMNAASSTEPAGLITHDRILEKLRATSKTRTVKRWLQSFGSRSAWYRKELQKHFVDNGILKEMRRRFIGIPYKLYFPAVRGERQKLIRRYKDILLFGKKPDETELMVLGLIYACRMHRILADKGPDRRKIRKAVVKQIKDNPVASEINKAIIEMQMAITASIAAASAASAASSASSSH